MFINFGAGIIGRIISGLIEVLIVILAYVLVEIILQTVFGFSIPDVVEKIGTAILALYFVGRVFGFIGPANI